MSRRTFDPDTIIPPWVLALALIDEEQPSPAELRDVVPSGVSLSRELERAGLVERLEGRNYQLRSKAKLRLTDEGARRLQRCLVVLGDFLRGEEDVPGEALRDEVAS